MRAFLILLVLTSGCATARPAPAKADDSCRKRVMWCQRAGSESICVEIEAGCNDPRVNPENPPHEHRVGDPGAGEV